MPDPVPSGIYGRPEGGSGGRDEPGCRAGGDITWGLPCRMRWAGAPDGKPGGRLPVQIQ